MKASQIISKLDSAQNGSFKSVTTQTTFHNKNGETFTNTTVLVGQNNINYAKRKNVKRAIEAGVRKEPVLRDCYKKVTLDGVVLNEHVKTGQLYLPVNFMTSKATVRNEAGKEVSKPELRAMQFDSKNKPSFMKKETTITNCKAKLDQAKIAGNQVEIDALQFKLAGYENPSEVLGQENHVTPKLETVIAIS
jgi:hypothetical protein